MAREFAPDYTMRGGGDGRALVPGVLPRQPARCAGPDRAGTRATKPSFDLESHGLDTLYRALLSGNPGVLYSASCPNFAVSMRKGWDKMSAPLQGFGL